MGSEAKTKEPNFVSKNDPSLALTPPPKKKLKLKNNLRDAYYLVTQSGRQILTDYIGEAKSLEKAGEGDIYVDVRFLAFDQLGESTWSVDWREIERKTGVVIGTREMRGTFLYERGEAESIIEAENNPLGIYFSSFDIRERRRE